MAICLIIVMRGMGIKLMLLSTTATGVGVVKGLW